ncbi:SDR family oxidoreductase [Pseudooceanicola marinus]|uniref:SDR family oxidoreductase n=1 Tax=Pseudooceanicola marinus TaxID=396013 RepID=UPI001CD49B38|nr:SDR family oxidoreductase [Pseudooceanicola marinus]MCA1338165.1 SDR family oxidoreductase [Pseudooceanicola marinus]
MSKEAVLVLGARSDIGQAVARRFAQAGHAVQLAARNTAGLADIKTDLELRYGVQVTTCELDVLQTGALEAFIDSLPELPITVVCAVGTMNDQEDNEQSLEAATLDMRSNFEAPALLLGLFANRFEARGRGTIVGISSVAGDRGRASNYVYGAAKAGFSAFLSGLRNRLASSDVHVLTVKPGFVATKMTEGLDLPEKLTAQPEELGEAIFTAVRKRRNVIYCRRIWWLIMLIIRSIPEGIFKKMSI